MSLHEEKRNRVLGRLLQPDAATVSDRAIARQCGVSQPFVSKWRKWLSTERDSEDRSAAGCGDSEELACAAVAVPSAVTADRVRVLEMGFYGNSRRREGDVFTLTHPSHFSSRWMERVDE